VSYKISDDCISCGVCESECPNKAISEGATCYEIDSERCSECVGSFPKQQCVEICPVGAPRLDQDHQEGSAQLLAKWVLLHPGEAPKST